MNSNYVKRNTEMDRIVKAFSGYIHRHPNLDLLWSEKLGYVLLSIDTVRDCLYGTSILAMHKSLLVAYLMRW